MKRKPILLAIALLLVVGAALWGVNYRLDHPPLTDADKEFRALVAGADRTVIAYYPSSQSKPVRVTLSNIQTAQFIETFRFSRELPYGSATPGANGYCHIAFSRQDKIYLFANFGKIWTEANYINLDRDSCERAMSFSKSILASKKASTVLWTPICHNASVRKLNCN